MVRMLTMAGALRFRSHETEPVDGRRFEHLSLCCSTTTGGPRSYARNSENGINTKIYL